MDRILPIASLLGGIALGSFTCWLLLRSNLAHVTERLQGRANAEIATLRADQNNRDIEIKQLKDERELKEIFTQKLRSTITKLRVREKELITIIQHERVQAREKLELLNDAQQKLTSTFKILSVEALSSSNKAFLQLANETFEKFQRVASGDLDKRQQAIDSLLKPVEKSLKEVDEKLQDVEKSRLEAYSILREQVKSLAVSQKDLRNETANLVKALRRPEVRGRWGEIQLRRVVELAGMVGHCDFYEQRSLSGEEGKQRPDLTVRLPGNKYVVVDSKAPLSAYLEAVEAVEDATRTAKLKEHSRLVRGHMQALGKKTYFAKIDQAPEFVVLFLPGEAFFSAALEADPALIEAGMEHNVIIATPTTLIALLRAVAYGWQQEQLTRNAKVICDLGKELYGRLSQMGDHLSKVGKGIEGATKAYNLAVGSFEGRVLVSARKFDDLHVAIPGKTLDELLPIDVVPRELQTRNASGVERTLFDQDNDSTISDADTTP